MFKKIFKRVVFWIYNKYQPRRVQKAKKELADKKKIGHNQTFEASVIPISKLIQALKEADINPNDTVFLRVSLSAANAFEGGFQVFLESIMSYFGMNGTLVMSSYTFNKSPIMYLADNPLFDPMRSIDRLNLVSEFFRRSDGVLRSVHPTHSVCAFGKHADWIVSEHDISPHCYHDKSPFAKLYKLDAKEVSIGVYPTSITIHYVEQFAPKNEPSFRDLDIPIACRIISNGHEVIAPFFVTDSFDAYEADYSVFNNTDAQPKMLLIDNKIDLHVLRLSDQLDAMMYLLENKANWLKNTRPFKRIILKFIVKPILIGTFFNLRGGVLYPLNKTER